jgi:AcrR family transcriptional regulator
MRKQEPSARVQYKREQARSDILTAAQNLLRVGGVDGLTLASVAGELGMTKQALYHYFPSKEALLRCLITQLLDEEISVLSVAIANTGSPSNVLGTMIRAFYDHYVVRLDAFRVIYCQSQLDSGTKTGLDEDTLRNEINPRTRHLFDLLEEHMSVEGMSKKERKKVRLLGFLAWTSALGLLTMLSVADATHDPLVHSDQDLLNTLSVLFEKASLPLQGG